MSEQIPNSAKQNYNLEEQQSGLILATQAGFNTYKEHPHSVDYFGQEGLGQEQVIEQPVKQRGITYTETELGGKPFIIAERPSSSVGNETQGSHPQDQNEAQQDHDASEKNKAEEKEPFSDPLKVKYNSNEDGSSYGWVFAQEGDNLEWSKSEHTNHEDREIIISTTDGDQLYVRGKKVYHLGETKKRNAPYFIELDKLEDLSDVTVGEPFALKGSLNGSSVDGIHTSAVTNVEIALHPESIEESDLEHYEESGMDDPFDEAASIVESVDKTQIIPAAEKGGQATTSLELVPYEPKNFRERMKLKFRQAKYGLMALATNKAYQAKEYFTDEEKGRRRKVIGAAAGVVALGAAVWGISKLGSGHELLDNSNSQGNSGGATTGMENTPTNTGGAEAPAVEQSPSAPENVDPPKTAANTETADLSMELGKGQNVDTIWEQSENWLQTNGYEANDYNIDLVKDAVLKHQGITEAQATSLPVGYKFEIPQEVIEELTKAKS